MNWEALGAIGEIVGAVAVVLTLGYLAVQIRQNTRADRVTAFHAAASGMANVVSRIADSEELAHIFDTGLRGDALSGSEETRFDALFSLFFGNYENLYYQHREAAVEPELWESRSHAMFWYLKQPGGLAYWQRHRNLFSRSFREHVDSHLAKQAGQGATEADRP